MKYLYSILIVFLFFSVFRIYHFSEKDVSYDPSAQNTVYSDTVHILASQNLTAISPYEAIFADDVFLINQVYQGLVKLDNHMIEIPDLAKFWTVDSNHTCYTFYLRRNQFFHNGEEVTADDVIESLEYFLKVKTESYIRPYFKVIKGVEKFWQGKSSHVSGIRKESPMAVRFLLKHPYIPFLKLLSLPEAKVVPASILRKPGVDLNENPIGSGPYLVKKRDASSILLEAFQWDERKGLSTHIKYFKIWVDEKVIADRFEKDNFDISYRFLDGSINSTSQFDYFYSPSLSLTFLGVNCQKPPTNNQLFRKALFYGINQKEVRRHFDKIGNPVNFYCPLNLPRDVESLSAQHFNSRKAKIFLTKALHQSNSKVIPKLSIAVDSSIYSNEVTKAILNNLDSLNIKYNIAYYSRLSLEDESRFIKNHNLFLFGWYMDVPDPEYFFDVLFNSNQSTNLMQYSNARVDSLLNESYSNRHLEDRLRTYVVIEKFLMEDVPIIPLLNDFEDVIFRKSLKNVTFNRLGIVGLELSKVGINITLHQKYLAQLKNDKKRS